MHRPAAAEAVYEDEGGRLFHVALAPADILDPRGDIRPVWLITQTIESNERHWAVDGSPGVVRMGALCARHDPCDNAWVSWEAHGRLDPWGVATRLALEGGAIDRAVPGGEFSVAVDERPHERLRIVEVLAVSVPELGISWQARTFAYDDRALPAWVEDSEGHRLTRVELQEGEALPDMAPWPTVEAAPLPSSHLVFDEEKVDHFRAGETHREAVDWLLANESAAARSLQRGCVLGYLIQLPVPEQGLGDPREVRREVFFGGHEPARWRFTTQEDLLGRRSFGAATSGSYDPLWPCPSQSAVGAAPAGSLSSFEDCVAEIEALLQHGDRVDFAVYARTLEGRDSEVSQLQYQFDYVPPSTAPGLQVAMKYSINWEPATGTLLSVMTHPDAIHKLDEGALGCQL